MSQYFGDFAEDETLYIPFNTFDSNDPSASVTITNLVAGDIHVHKDGGTTQLATDGATIAIDFDGVTGNHLITIDTSAHADYSTGSDYMVRIEGTTVDAATINAWVGSFSIENRYKHGVAQTVDNNVLAAGATGFAAIDTVVDTILSRVVGTLAAGTHNPASTAQLGALTDWIDGGRLDLLLDAIKVVTDAQTAITPAALVDLVWDEDIVASHTTANTSGLILSNTSNLSVGAGGISTTAGSATVTTGTETLTYTSSQELDGTTHDIAPDTGNTEFYYEFDVGITGVATEVLWDGHAESNGDSYTISAYDWVAASFKVVGTIGASNSTASIERAFVLDKTMTGSGANAGVVRWQVTSADGTNFSTDRVLVEYTALPEAGSILHSGIAQAGASNTITLDSGASSTDDFYNHARVIISSGTGSEQERIIIDYTGSTRVAKIGPPWVTNPDNTSAFEVEPATVHSETGWATIKVGIAAAGTSTTITLDSDGSAVDDFYNGDLIHIDAGTGDGQTRYITDYNGTTKVATIDPAWITNPDTTSEYIVEEGHPYITSDLAAIDTKLGTPAADISADIADVPTVAEFEARTPTASQLAYIVDNAATGLPVTFTTSGGGTTTAVLNLVDGSAGSATDDQYNGRLLVFTNGTLKGVVTDILDYTGSTTTATITAIPTAPTSAHNARLI